MIPFVAVLLIFGGAMLGLGLYAGLVFAGRETGRVLRRLPSDQADAFLASLKDPKR